MQTLVKEIRQCTICAEFLPLGPRPVVHIEAASQIIIIGQAPGTRVHKSGIPWDDPSGDTLRQWLNVEKPAFYNTANFGIMPMGFCYPGKGKSGDLPPRKECAPQWHPTLMEKLSSVKMVLLIGQYAQKYYLRKKAKPNLTETVKAFKEYAPLYFPLPHPSPRNRLWLKKNPWFNNEVIPALQQQIMPFITL